MSTVIQNTVSTVLRRETCQPFSISDETGKAHVDGPFFLGLDFGAFIAVPEYRHSSLEEAGVPTSGILFDRRFAYREVLLRPGDRISIFGLVFLEPDPTVPAAGLRSPPLVARIQGSDDQPIIVVRAREQLRLLSYGPERGHIRIAAPARHTAVPMASLRSGRWPSTHHPHRADSAMNTAPYAA